MIGHKCLVCETGVYDQPKIEHEVQKIVHCTSCGHEVSQYKPDSQPDDRLTLSES